MVRAGSTTVSEDPSILRCAGVVARMFSGAGMEAVSKRGVCLRTLVGVGLMMDGSREEVRLLVGLISFVLVRVTVMNLVLFWLSSTLNVYGERMVATWDRIKFAKLRRCVGRVHFDRIQFKMIRLICDGPETPTKISECIIPTNWDRVERCFLYI